jgi:2,4-diaminopentanoate dehydrogenase
MRIHHGKCKGYICGLGAMGSGIAKRMLQKKGVEIVSVVDSHEDKVGKDLS